jgi:hypothetical protein
VTVTMLAVDRNRFIINAGRVSGPQRRSDAGEATQLGDRPLDLPAQPAA